MPYIRNVIVLLLLACATLTNAQNTGISNTAGSASINAVLDLNSGNSSNMGLIIPHVSLNTTLTQFSPPMAGSATTKDVGMIVYNTNSSAGSGVGYYYWNGSAWIMLGTGSGGTVTSVGSGFGIQGGPITAIGTLSIDTTRNAKSGIPTYWATDSIIRKNTDTASWHIGGNSNIVDGTYFLGTTNNVPLNFEVNGGKGGRIDPINYNTYLGYQSGNSTTASTTGTQNVGIGCKALYGNTSGSENTATGYEALYHNTSSYNTATGYEALYNNTSGSENTAMGLYSLVTNTSGSYNDAIGDSSLAANTTGSSNTAMGEKALNSNTTASGNTAIGASALNSNTTASGNTATGFEALYSSTGGANTGNGYEVLYSNTTGSDNTAFGDQAIYSNTTGKNNTAIGLSTLNSNTTGSGSTANGYYALYNSIGDHNTALGDSAGYNETSGKNNTFIGYNAEPSTIGFTNATAIGNGATVTASNTAVMGNSSLAIFTLGGGSYAAPVQESTATSGTVSSNGAQILSLSGAASSLTIAAPSSPVEGQTWMVSTNQSSITITWSGSFASAPSTIGKTSPARFFYSTTTSEWENF